MSRWPLDTSPELSGLDPCAVGGTILPPAEMLKRSRSPLGPTPIRAAGSTVAFLSRIARRTTGRRPMARLHRPGPTYPPKRVRSTRRPGRGRRRRPQEHAERAAAERRKPVLAVPAAGGGEVAVAAACSKRRPGARGERRLAEASQELCLVAGHVVVGRWGSSDGRVCGCQECWATEAREPASARGPCGRRRARWTARSAMVVASSPIDSRIAGR